MIGGALAGRAADNGGFGLFPRDYALEISPFGHGDLWVGSVIRPFGSLPLVVALLQMIRRFVFWGGSAVGYSW